jgi:hypothetical protein
MSDEKPVQTPPSFIEDTTTPEIFADVAIAFHLLNGVLKVTLGSVRHGACAPSAKRVVVGRVVTSVPAARDLAVNLLRFLKSQGIDVTDASAATKTTKATKGTTTKVN